MQETIPQHGRVTCHYGLHLHGLTPQVCMRTRRVCYGYEPQELVLRRTTSVDVGGETKACCDYQPQEGFVAAKLLVDRPTTASDLGGISQMEHGYRKMKREFRGDLMTS